MVETVGGRYQLDERIGSGAMGDVYRATDCRTGEVVAVKALKPALVRRDPSLLARFRREGEALRELAHPNIVTLLEVVSEQQGHYLVMEYVPGGDLAGLLADNPEGLPLKRAVTLALDVADALTRAHRLDIIHRDLKPANVLIAADGTPRLSDFGVALVVERERLTASHGIIGTLDYLPPEALLGEAIDTCADIWSFGVMLFEMLTGRRPFRGDTLAGLLTSILHDQTPDLGSALPGCPVDLVDLLYRMLEKDRLARIPSVRHVGAALEDIAHGRTRDRPPTRFETPAPDIWERPLHNLPPQSTPFVGREREITELARMLAETDSGFVSIVAPGGMGKTRLALALAERYVPAGSPDTTFKDGVYFIELAPLHDPAAIVTAVASATGYKLFNDGRDLRQQILDFLCNKQMLLVLDNFEHILEGAALVEDIRHAAPGVAVVTTSRQRLAQPGERLFHLTGMEFPAWEAPEDALAYAAVKLFMNSARRAQPRFELSRDNLDDVARICRLVGGMPLGIVLAASWLAVLSPREVADEIQGGLDILEAAGGEVEARHQSMRAVFDQSWRMLAPGEQAVFAQLSVFRGGFTRGAVQAVTGVDLRTLMDLVNKSLIRRRVSTGRFEMHALLRQYAAEKLEAAGNAVQVRDVHATYFAGFVAERDLDAGKYSQKEMADSIDADFENIQAAWYWAVQQQRVDLLMKMVLVIWDFAWLRRHRADAIIPLYEHALSALEHQEHLPLYSQLCGRLLTCLSNMVHNFLGMSERVEDLAIQGLSMLQKADDPVGLAFAQARVAVVKPLAGAGNLSDSLIMLDKSVQTFLRLGSLSRAANAQRFKAIVMIWIGSKLTERTGVLQGSVQMARQGGDHLMLCMALGDLGNNWRGLGDYPQAMTCLQESLAIAGRHGLGPLHGGSIADLYAVMGDYTQARTWSDKLLAFARANNAKPLAANTMIKQAWIAALEGKCQEAEELLDECQRRYPVLSKLEGYDRTLGLAAYRRGDYECALRQCQAILKEQPLLDWLIDALHLRGLAQVGLGQLVAARQSLVMGLEKVHATERRFRYPQAVYGLAEIAAESDRKVEAVELAALLHRHPVTPRYISEYAEALLERLEPELAPAAYAAAYARGKARDLDETVRELLAENADV